MALWLACCPGGSLVTVRWIEKVQGQCGNPDYEIVRHGSDATHGRRMQPFDKLTTPYDWVLATPPELFGESQVVRVRFCPGCGKSVPGLRRRETMTFHAANYDENGHCNTCRIRYCDGQDPSRVYEIDPDERGVFFARIEGLLGQIPDKESTVIRYYYGERRSQAEIAGILGVTQAAVSHRITDGLHRIRALQRT